MKKTYILIGFLVIALSSVVGFGTYFISSSYMALDQQAVNEARAMLVKQLTYYPIEGVDFNILSMVESTLPNNTDVSILSSNSSQISNDGTITYENEPTTAIVTVKIRKRRSSVTEQITVVIPVATETDDTNTSVNNDTGTGDEASTSTDNGSGSTTTDTSNDNTNDSDITANNDIMPTGALNVTSYGANGSNQTDDTAAINSAITAAYNKGGGVVWVPGGTYMIDITGDGIGISMKSNVTLQMSSSSTLRSNASSLAGYKIILIGNANNVTVNGGNIIGDRKTHNGTSGEWGMGISILGSSNVHILNVNISDCWGDGIYIANSSQKTYSENILVENFNLTNNRRQGISIISVKKCTIRNGEISYTNGVDPQSGIDVEPNSTSQYIQGLLMENINTEYNQGYGIEFTWGYFLNTTNPSDITIKNHTDTGSIKGKLRPYSHLISNICKIIVM